MKVYLFLLLSFCLVSCAKSGSSDLPSSITVDYKITPSADTFGPVEVGTESAEIEFKFENKGNVPLSNCTTAAISEGTNTEFEITKDDCGSSGFSIHGACSVFVKAKPTSAGAKASALVRRCVGGSNGLPMISALTALGVSALTSTAPDPFPDTPATTSSAPVDFTFTNAAASAATGCTDPVITGTDAAEFSIVPGGCGVADLAAGDHCVVSVIATPAAVQAYSATLTYTCSVGGSLSYPLAVNGI